MSLFLSMSNYFVAKKMRKAAKALKEAKATDTKVSAEVTSKIQRGLLTTKLALNLLNHDTVVDILGVTLAKKANSIEQANAIGTQSEKLKQQIHKHKPMIEKTLDSFISVVNTENGVETLVAEFKKATGTFLEKVATVAKDSPQKQPFLTQAIETYFRNKVKTEAYRTKKPEVDR